MPVIRQYNCPNGTPQHPWHAVREMPLAELISVLKNGHPRCHLCDQILQSDTSRKMSFTTYFVVQEVP